MMDTNNAAIRSVVYDAVLKQMRSKGKMDEQILEWVADVCPCDDCRAKRGGPPKEHFALDHKCTETRHSNYYPLIITDVRYMAMKAFQAKNNGDHWTVNDIMRRLCQAIPGQVCPHQLGGHVDKVEIHLCEYYLANVKFHGADPTFAEELFAIINS
jgi:hypothetical protein